MQDREIEVTEGMVAAGRRELWGYIPGDELESDVVTRIFLCMCAVHEPERTVHDVAGGY